MANILDYFKMWQESPHTADLQGLLDPNPDYAQQYLYPMSPNNPFGLQERSMGLLGGMQQSANQAVVPQSPPTQYVEPLLEPDSFFTRPRKKGKQYYWIDDHEGGGSWQPSSSGGASGQPRIAYGYRTGGMVQEIPRGYRR